MNKKIQLGIEKDREIRENRETRNFLANPTVQTALAAKSGDYRETGTGDIALLNPNVKKV